MLCMVRSRTSEGLSSEASLSALSSMQIGRSTRRSPTLLELGQAVGVRYKGSPIGPVYCPLNHGTPHAIWYAKNSTDSASGPNLSTVDASFNLQAHRSFLIWVNGRPRCKKTSQEPQGRA